MSESVSRCNGQSWSVMSENHLSEKFPLHRACRDGDIASLKLLLHQEAAPSHITLEDTYYGWTPTHWAAYFGRLDCLRLLVCGVGNGVSADPGLKTSRFTQTPVHIAAFAGHPHCLQWLLQAGADPNAQDYLGETSLHKAARTGSAACIGVLLDSKASLVIRNNNGQTAAQLANACSFTELANQLLQMEGKQGVTTDVNGSITRSVPAHGLNGGVFPHYGQTALFANHPVSEQPSVQNNTNGFSHNGTSTPLSNGSGNDASHGVCTSSNGYYGFQPANGSANGHKNGHVENGDDCEMETDTPAMKTEHVNGSVENGSTVTASNPSRNVTLGFTNGHVIGTVMGFTGAGAVKPKTQTNGIHTSPVLRMGDDITLSRAVSQNEVPIGGCKRSREDGTVPQMKRMKTEGPLLKVNPSISSSQVLSTSLETRVPFCDLTNIGGERLHELSEAKLHSVYTPKDLFVNFDMTAESSSDMDAESSYEIKKFSSLKEHSDEPVYNLYSEMLRETHGCEIYSFTGTDHYID
ncbi:ankyrin repeat domain-containing protein 10-like isoform X2 [Macrobrachium rosenbergii]|uniref:ankyrin repeat domain-containing protein 10-like isoform X2 n=1 Tax=Macrobrachium rosenbergii TaxID=79674 RepID=UPI0034D69538